MSTLTIRLPEDTAQRLKSLAQTRGLSMNKLIEELSAQAIAAFDVERVFVRWLRVATWFRPWPSSIAWTGKTQIAVHAEICGASSQARPCSVKHADRFHPGKEARRYNSAHVMTAANR